jgi:hypothetical protein
VYYKEGTSCLRFCHWLWRLVPLCTSHVRVKKHFTAGYKLFSDGFLLLYKQHPASCPFHHSGLLICARYAVCISINMAGNLSSLQLSRLSHGSQLEFTAAVTSISWQPPLFHCSSQDSQLDFTASVTSISWKSTWFHCSSHVHLMAANMISLQLLRPSSVLSISSSHMS